MNFLHIIKDPESREALEIITKQALSSGKDIGIVLIQGAGNSFRELPGNTRVLKGPPGGPKSVESGENGLDYAGLLDLIFDSEKVAVW